MEGFISKYVREQKRYTKNEIKDLFEFTETETEQFIRKLKAYGVVKSVRNTPAQRDLTDLLEDEVTVTDATEENGDCFYVFTYVGILTLANRIIKCYPKYIAAVTEPDKQMKQVLKVLQRYGTKEQIINMYNGDGQTNSFNLLAVLLYLMDDYHQYGPYINTEDIVEVNGEGSILWEQTIDHGFAIISENRPYYVDFYTKRTVDDERDFFYRLHRSVVTECSRQLRDSGLLYLFDMIENELTEECVEDFGDSDHILYRLQSELNIQFNTRKQMVLKALYAYIANRQSLAENQGISMYGTATFHTVWEDVCAEVLGDKLNHQLRHLPLPNGVADGFIPSDRLIDVIKKPQWIGYKPDGDTFTEKATETLEPDLITLTELDGRLALVIFDAKYYCLQLLPGRPLRGQPGVGDVTKQYLYQLAYKVFMDCHGIENVRNCFLMPTEQDTIIRCGKASMEILDSLGLQQIEIRLLPAERMYQLYLTRCLMDITELQL